METTVFRVVGVRIRTIRNKKKMTQEKLAELINMDPRSIIDIEMGNRNPTLQTIYRICKALKIKSADLLSFLKLIRLEQDLIQNYQNSCLPSE